MHKLTATIIAATLMAFPCHLWADEIGLKTNKAVGETIEIALNADLAATLTWSNGESETVSFDGKPQSLTVKADSLTITTATATITRFYAPDAGLVSLNTANAASLLKLIVPSNALTSLNLSKNKALTDIDCQGNALTTLNLTGCSKLQYINCADNALSALNYPTTTYLQTIVCENNAIDTLKYQTGLRKIETLWCDGNALRTLKLTNSTSLKSLAAQSNALSTLTLANMPKLTDVLVGSNALDSIDLSLGSPKLVSLYAENNKLTRVRWDTDCKSTLRYVYLGNNSLFFNSFPTLSDEMVTNFMPQAAYPLTGNIIVDEQQDWSDVLFRNAFNATTGAVAVVTNAAGETLERGKDKDYYYSMGKWTFYTLQKGVSITMTSTRYPDVTLTIQPFDVTDATGFHTATQAADLDITATDGHLTVSTAKAAVIKVFDIAGRCLISENVAAGQHTWPLTSGTYIVNGKKVIVTQ